MAHQAPPGWRHNPSSFTRRARVASGAAINAALVLTLDVPDPSIQAACAFASISIGIVALIGDSRRWIRSPWLIAIHFLVAIPVSLTQTGRLVASYLRASRIDGMILVYVGISFLIAGAVLDESLANIQVIRRQLGRTR